MLAGLFFGVLVQASPCVNKLTCKQRAMEEEGAGGLWMALGSEPHVDGKMRERDGGPRACWILWIEA